MSAREFGSDSPGTTARLIVSGKDRPGIVSAVSGALQNAGANIVSLDQYSTDPEGGRFFQRTVFHVDDLSAALPGLERELTEKLTGQLGVEFALRPVDQLKRVAIFASKSDHCLLELLWRHRRGDLQMEVAMVVSNHEDLRTEVEQFGIEYHYVPADPNDRSAAERKHLELLDGKVDFVVLARYMQIITEDFLREVGVPVINIHHSFLPAFIGAGPYAKAKERGVKLIGATAHYVTEELDEGPIIEQDVIRVTHAYSAADLQRRGAYVERQVLARAVEWHLEDRVMRDGNSTVVFR